MSQAFDKDTGEVLPFPGAADRERLQELEQKNEQQAKVIERLEHEVKDLEGELRAKRRIISELRGERNQAPQNDPLKADIEMLFDYWRAQCNHPKSVLDDQRFELLKRGLRDHGKAACARAIVGYGAYPYVSDRSKRREATGARSERYDDLELIFRNAKQIEKGWALADRAEEEALQDEEAA